MQKIFNPFDYCFSWTDDGWYSWDRREAHSQALKARNAEARRLRKEGYDIRKFSLSGQLVRKGGIGSGKPDVEAVVNCYGLNAY